jgi:hypothetical protein
MELLEEVFGNHIHRYDHLSSGLFCALSISLMHMEGECYTHE